MSTTVSETESVFESVLLVLVQQAEIPRGKQCQGILYVCEVVELVDGPCLRIVLMEGINLQPFSKLQMSISPMLTCPSDAC